MTTPPATNLELKVRCDEAALDQVRRRAERAGAARFTRWRQVDAYFRVQRGRLKLREMTAIDGVQSAELIAYRRPDQAGPRWSAYHRAPVAADDAATMRTALAETLGVLTVVDKTRDVAVVRRTRIHLDRVRGMGEFVELETVVTGEEEATSAAEELAEVAGTLGLGAYEIVAGSYSDLAIAVAECKEQQQG